MRSLLVAAGVFLHLGLATRLPAGPSLAEVIASPQSFAGKALTFAPALLSGKITTYDVAGVRKYYLVVEGGQDRLEAGFFLAPPRLADRLATVMDAGKNYRVGLTCKVERITINEVPQWHGIVTRVSFLDDEGKVVRTVEDGPPPR